MNRVSDIFTSMMLLILSLPVWFIIMIMIKLTSRGPIFFKQIRIGKNGRSFIIYKFRTLYDNTNPYTYKPMSKDNQRITSFGNFLRSKGLDELPQLWNILKGDMGLVGPRPEMPFIVEEYNSLEKLRLAIKPGITGLWQVLAPRNRPIHKNVKYDLYYIRNRNIKLDLWIIFQTLRVLVEGERIV